MNTIDATKGPEGEELKINLGQENEKDIPTRRSFLSSLLVVLKAERR